MSLNTLRLNHAPSSHPNDRIVFIKPLPRPSSQSNDYQMADTLLRAIAAQCLPVMTTHFLSVTTLEEHEPNREFIGRNFNNGEIIQLVLRGHNGSWLPINMIQMVMMHELAHNMHMNHGKKFWETRNLFAGEMRALWGRGYTGEGFWGSGRTLSDLGKAMGDNVVRSEELNGLPVCGGTFRSRRRKRRVKMEKGEELSWKEKKQRRIEKKFGKNGVALGEDEDKRSSLELSKKGPVGGKPRVAQSKRGRELRAAAALARFETTKKQAEDLDGIKDEAVEFPSDNEYEVEDIQQGDALDTDGSRLLDGKGQGMIKVCEEEIDDDVYFKQEIQELEGLNLDVTTSKASGIDITVTSKPRKQPKSLYDIPQYQADQETSIPNLASTNNVAQTNKLKINIHPLPTSTQKSLKTQPTKSIPTATQTTSRSDSPTATPQPGILPNKRSSTTIPCPICSLTNDNVNPTCAACGHVLDRRIDPRSWKCTSETCNNHGYVNAGDAGFCGICGGRKSA